METHQNNPKIAVLWQNHPLRENFQNSSIKAQQMTLIYAFCQNFMSICPITKKCEFNVPVTKKLPPFLPPLGTSLAHATKILTHEI